MGTAAIPSYGSERLTEYFINEVVVEEFAGVFVESSFTGQLMKVPIVSNVSDVVFSTLVSWAMGPIGTLSKPDPSKALSIRREMILNSPYTSSRLVAVANVKLLMPLDRTGSAVPETYCPELSAVGQLTGKLRRGLVCLGLVENCRQSGNKQCDQVEKDKGRSPAFFFLYHRCRNQLWW